MALSSAIVFCGICAFASDGFVVTPEKSFVSEERYSEQVYYPVLGDSSFPIAKAINDKITKSMSEVRENIKNTIIETQEVLMRKVYLLACTLIIRFISIICVVTWFLLKQKTMFIPVELME